MIVRRAKLHNANELAKIDKIAKLELKGWSSNTKSDFAKIIKKSKQYIFVVEDKDIIIGYLSLRTDKESKWVWVEDVYVLKSWRKKGVARRLIGELLKYHNKNMPKRRVVLLTADRNLKIFESLGFKKTMNFMEYDKKK